MQETVDKQIEDEHSSRHGMRGCLPLRFLEADEDLPARLPRRIGEHIRRIRLLAELLVQFLRFLRPDEYERYVPTGEYGCSHRGICETRH